MLSFVCLSVFIPSSEFVIGLLFYRYFLVCVFCLVLVCDPFSYFMSGIFCGGVLIIVPRLSGPFVAIDAGSCPSAVCYWFFRDVRSKLVLSSTLSSQGA